MRGRGRQAPRPRGRRAGREIAEFEAHEQEEAERTEATEDELWLCEHPPVFTQGLAGSTLGVAAGAFVARTSPQATWPAPDTPASSSNWRLRAAMPGKSASR